MRAQDFSEFERRIEDAALDRAVWHRSLRPPAIRPPVWAMEACLSP